MITETVDATAREIIAHPDRLTDDLHDLYCEGGYIYTMRDGQAVANRCPRCRADRMAREAEERIRASGIGERYWPIDWGDLEMVEPLPRLRAASERIRDVIESGHCLLLHGKAGTGKTQSAVLLLKAAIRAGFSARLENLGLLGAEIRHAYEADGPSEATVIRELSNVGLLILDDLGAGETGAAKIESRVLYLVTEARQNARRPTVITTNLAPKELANQLGARIMNRLQPLAVMGFTHDRNFRRQTEKTTWEA